MTESHLGPSRFLVSLATTALLSTVLIAGFLLSSSESQAAVRQEEASWSPDDCAVCHAEAVEALASTAHVALDRKGTAEEWGAAHSCEACHGDPSEHIDGGGNALFNFDSTPMVNAQRCQPCHSSSHPRFARSEHAKAGLDCSSCHVSHPGAEILAAEVDTDVPAELQGRPSATCAECHQAAFTQFSFTERHRIEEGALECTSCHDPHAPSSRTMLAGFKQEACTECHVDKGGPFVFEHGAQRVEGCVSCHAPHGSANRHMLNFQQVAEQCYSCHAFIPGFHSRFTAETQCTSCHATIHGSNLDPAFLK